MNNNGIDRPTQFNFVVLDILTIAANVYTLLSDYPLIGVFTTSVFIWTKVSAWRREKELVEHSRALIAMLHNSEEFENSQRVIALMVNTHSMSATELRSAMEAMRLDFGGYVDKPSVCNGCKYFYGKQRIVCAVHPSGVETDVCSDFDNS